MKAETMKTPRFWLYVILVCLVIAISIRKVRSYYNDDSTSSSTPTTQTQVESKRKPCVLIPLKIAEPQTLGKPFPGEWWAEDGIIKVVQSPNTYSENLGSHKGPTVRKKENIFEFSFDPDTGKGYWSMTAANLSGEIVASREGKLWRVIRMEGEGKEEFLFQPNSKL